jgi:tetratricopeptide (TPR) repeat protein/transcriptional regulator with XRE-family HTH domain
VNRDAGPASPDFGGLLRRLRIDAGLTQEELAEAATVSPRSVSDLERGVSRTARPPTARLLAAALGLAGPKRAGFLATARGQAPPDTPQPTASGPAASAAIRALPRDIAGFTGRSSELDWLMTRLASVAGGGSRVVDICAIGGMAGVGKTTLAVHAAHQLAAGHPDGQFFLPLHGHTPGQRPADPADALASLLLAAGLQARQIPPGLEPRAARWRDFLAGKKILLVLDDAAGHEQVEPLLPGAPGSTVLVTSRRRLAALGDAAVISLDILVRDEAADMLVRLAGRPGLQSADPGVGELTRLCGYLPLAIGMVAGQLRHHPAWTPADRAAELAAERDKLGLMHAENISVGAAFSLSYQDLTAGQRRMFRRLGLQPGPEIDAHAAAAVGGVTLATARRQLEAVYDQHLITEPGRGRYRMHDLVREHARALAADDDPVAREAASGRLMDYYLQTALTASRLIGTRIVDYMGALPAGSPPDCAPTLTTAEQATRWMQAEQANLRAAAENAAATGRIQHATLIPAAMAEFLHIQGRWRDGIALHQTAVAAARAAGDPASHARALILMIHMQVQVGDLRAARANLNQVMKLYRQLDDRLRQADVLISIGGVANLTDQYPQALLYARKALKIFRETGNQRGEAAALHSIGTTRWLTGDCHAATAWYRQALSLFRAIGGKSGEAETLIGLATIQTVTGDYAQATATFDLAMAAAREAGNQYLQAWVVNAVGVVQRRTGDYDAAVASSRAALEQFRVMDLALGEANALSELGLALQLAGDCAAAAASHQRALAIYAASGEQLGQAVVLNNLGELSRRRAATTDSQHYHSRALALAREIGAGLEEARALEGTGRCHLHDGHTFDGTTHLQQALAIYQRAGAAAARDVQETLAAQTQQLT